MGRFALLAALLLASAAPAAAAPTPATPAVPATSTAPATPAIPATTPSLTVSIAAPAAGARLTGAVSLSARATPADAAGVQFQLDGADLGPRVSSRPYTAVWNTAGTPDGAHLLTAQVFDRGGRSSSSDGVSVVVDNEPLSIGGVTVAGVTGTGATVSWTTSKPAEGQVEYGPSPAYGASTVLENGESLSHSAVLSNLTPGTTVHFRATAQSSAHPRVESEDALFETPSASTGGTPPTVAIMNPGPNAFVSGTVAASVNAAGPTPVASVQLMIDGTEIGAIATAPPFVFSWITAAVADGPHQLSAVAVDAAGNSATAVVTVNVLNAAPLLSAESVGGLGPDRADVLWTTDQRSDSAVDYGTSTLYGASTPLNPAQSTGHGAALRGLVPGTQYHYRVRSRNAAGVPSVSDDLTFTTPASTAAASAAAVPAAGPDLSAAKAPQKFLTPATADGINDKAVFGPAAREVTIFDVRGRKVFHGSSSAPGSPVVWDCKDGSGRVVEAGVYLAKIVARDSTTSYQSFAVAK